MSEHERQPSVRQIATAPIGIATGLVGEVASTTVAVVLAPVRAVGALTGAVARLQRTLDNLDGMTDGVANMERELRGMRADLADVIGELEGVRSGVGRLGPSVDGMAVGVDGIRGSVETLDARVDSLNTSIENVDALAARLTRLRSRRKDV